MFRTTRLEIHLTGVCFNQAWPYILIVNIHTFNANIHTLNATISLFFFWYSIDSAALGWDIGQTKAEGGENKEHHVSGNRLERTLSFLRRMTATHKVGAFLSQCVRRQNNVDDDYHYQSHAASASFFTKTCDFSVVEPDDILFQSNRGQSETVLCLTESLIIGIKPSVPLLLHLFFSKMSVSAFIISS